MLYYLKRKTHLGENEVDVDTVPTLCDGERKNNVAIDD